jgi:predicted dehydrogenase
MTLRVGLIGCGQIAEHGHLPALERERSVKVVAVADGAEERRELFGARLGLRRADLHNDYRALLDRNDLDLVSVATPPRTHREIVEAAAAAGKHVLCEKPLALTLPDTDSMLDACASAGVICGVYHNYLYHPETELARSMIENGSVGDVVATEITGLGARPSRGVAEYRPDWRYDIRFAGGGPLMDIGVHAFYLTESYHWSEASAVEATVLYGESGLDSHAFCRLRFESGTGLVNVAWGEGPAALTIVGTKAYLSFVYDEGAGFFGCAARAIRLASHGSPARTWYLAPERPWFQSHLYTEFAAAVSARDPKLYRAPGQAGRRALEIALASYASGASGAAVSLPLQPDHPIYPGGLAELKHAD